MQDFSENNRRSSFLSHEMRFISVNFIHISINMKICQSVIIANTLLHTVLVEHLLHALAGLLVVRVEVEHIPVEKYTFI